MKTKLTILAVIAVLLVSVFAFGGCLTGRGPQGDQGPAGPAGPAGECDCDVQASAATFVIVAEGCPDFEDEVLVFGSGFDAEDTITLYFAGEDKGQQLKWVKIDTNEVGAFSIAVDIPTYSEFNEDILKDVSVTEETVCGDVVPLTVGAYSGGDLVTTFPLFVPAKD